MEAERGIEDIIAIGYSILVSIKINYFILGKKRRKLDQNYQRKGLVKGKLVRMSTSIKKASYSKGALPILKVRKNSFYSI